MSLALCGLLLLLGFLPKTQTKQTNLKKLFDEGRRANRRERERERFLRGRRRMHECRQRLELSTSTAHGCLSDLLLQPRRDLCSCFFPDPMELDHRRRRSG